MSLYRKSTQADTQDGGVKRNRESLRQQPSTQSSAQSSSTQTQAQQPNTQNRTNNNKPLPPPPQSRFHVYDESDSDSSGHEYGVLRNQLAEDQRYDALGNELFYEDPAKYQNQGVVVSLRTTHSRSKHGVKTKTMTLRFATPPGAPEHFIIPDLEVKEGKDSSLKIDPELREGDFAYFDPRGYRWIKDYEKSESLAEERRALEIAQGKVKIPRVVLNTERMLQPTGIPSLYYEVPDLCSEHLRSAAITGIYDKGKRPSTMGKDREKIVIATHTNSPYALSIENCLQNLNTVIGGVYLWKQQLLPKVQTNDFMKRVISLGSDRNIINEMDRFMQLTYDNEVGPRVRARDDRLERRHEYLEEKRKREQNPQMLLEQRAKERERRRKEKEQTEYLASIKQQYVDTKRELESSRAQENQEQFAQREAQLAERARKHEERKQKIEQIKAERDEKIAAGLSVGDLDKLLENEECMFDFDYNNFGPDVEEYDQISVHKTPQRKERLQQYSSRISSKFYDDDSDSEAGIEFAIGSAKKQDVDLQSVKKEKTPKKIANTTPIKKVVFDSDSEDEFYTMIRQKRAEDMISTYSAPSEGSSVVPKKNLMDDSDNEDSASDQVQLAPRPTSAQDKESQLNLPTDSVELNSFPITDELDEENLFN